MNASLRPARAVPPGRIIQRELDARGWTQKDLAEIMGRPPQAINEIVRTRKRITPETAHQLAEAFGTSPEFWINLTGAYGLVGEYEKSIASAEKGLRVIQESDGLIRAIAVGYINLHEYNKALEIIERLPESERNKDSNISHFLKTMQRKN